MEIKYELIDGYFRNGVTFAYILVHQTLVYFYLYSSEGIHPFVYILY